MAAPSAVHKKVDGLWKWRAGFNDPFNCKKRAAAPPLDFSGASGVKAEDVMALLVYDMILSTAYEIASQAVPGVDEVREQICEVFVAPDADSQRMTKLLNAAYNMQTDVLFLNEIPRAWLQGDTFKNKAAEDPYKFYLDADDEARLHRADNTVVLLSHNAFDENSVTDVRYDAKYKALTLTAKPRGLSEEMELIGLHLDSAKNKNEERQNGIGTLAKVGKAAIAASDTNGDPRNAGYKGGKYFFEGILHNKAVYRATNAPWGEKDGSIRVYGTCNKMRTPMQFQVAKSNVVDRLMKDNIYYKDGIWTQQQDGPKSKVQVDQVDLCNMDSPENADCAPWTFAGRVHCFGLDTPHTDEQIQSKPTDDAEKGSDRKTQKYPVTCGYVGASTFLPNLASDWGLSDHMAVTAKFQVSVKTCADSAEC
eukprot:TRINITY_DN34912_c0_g1_i1.p1 TRINITY_DN34912_c0_g1~~TRINITY_DN34912_c0_g1_i1.p1  ORF type:complete len:422 (+),score=62.59 TRINITY_DN34912_c0_g1_i1:688-1953(+)